MSEPPAAPSAAPSREYPMSYVEIKDLEVSYGKFLALNGISFTVQERERICLLGPSGCGKTTTLQALAGFITTDQGEIRVAGRSLADQPPERRNIGIMFQNYALFPHMSVFDNIAFGLRMRKAPPREIEARVMTTLERVHLAHAAQKLPAMMSGGEQQRIAFARAVVIEPSLLLLDEPFSNLDARLRQEMRAELLELLADLPIATVMVTHDQEEAMAIADRIVVMRAGNIEQIGTPGEVYERPASLFAARFIGDTNLMRGRVSQARDDRIEIAIEGGTIVHARGHAMAPGTEVQVLVRPQRMRLAAGAVEQSGGALPVTVERVLFLGHRTEFHVRTASGHPQIIWLHAETSAEVRPGDEATATWDMGDTLVFPAAA